MGQYKVPQNVEAEDKIIGALTLKQFIYTIIGVLIAVVSFLTMRKAPLVMLIVGIPPTTLFLLLGLYQRHDQPFEALFLSLVSFMAKPRKRLWQKEPIEEVFKIEAPKVVKQVTQRDPEEVRGQLERLSQVVDSRGWGAKPNALQLPGDQPSLESEGRLVEPVLPTGGEPIETDVAMADDILDFQNNPTAHNIGALIQDQAKSIREEALTKLKQAQPAAPAAAPASEAGPAAGTVFQPSAPTPKPAVSGAPQPIAPTQNLSANLPASQGATVSASEMTTNPLNDILKLAMESDDLTVGQIAAQAKRSSAMVQGESVSLRANGNSSKQ